MRGRRPGRCSTVPGKAGWSGGANQDSRPQADVIKWYCSHQIVTSLKSKKRSVDDEGSKHSEYYKYLLEQLFSLERAAHYYISWCYTRCRQVRPANILLTVDQCIDLPVALSASLYCTVSYYKTSNIRSTSLDASQSSLQGCIMLRISSRGAGEADTSPIVASCARESTWSLITTNRTESLTSRWGVAWPGSA